WEEVKPGPWSSTNTARGKTGICCTGARRDGGRLSDDTRNMSSWRHQVRLLASITCRPAAREGDDILGAVSASIADPTAIVSTKCLHIFRCACGDHVLGRGRLTDRVRSRTAVTRREDDDI